MAPSKRRATSVPPAKAAKTTESEPKKAKVEDPSTIALNKLLEAVDGDLRGELPPKVVQMVLTVAPEALMSTVEERSDLEIEFGKVVGEALQQAQESLATKSTEAAAALEEREAEVKQQTTAVEDAIAVKEECDKAVETAAAAEKDAKDAKNTAIVHLNEQKDEESTLDETKEKYEQERADAQFALDTLKGETPPSAKDAKKLAQIMATVGAPEAMVMGVPTAVGKDGDVEKLFVTEAIKVMDANMKEVQGKQYDFQQHTDKMAATTKTMEEEVSALTATHEERSTELTECKSKQKTAAQGIKEAEAAQKQGGKALAKAQKVNEAADKDVANAADVYTSYEFLFKQSSAPVEPEKPAEEEPTEEKVEEVVEEKAFNMEATEEQPFNMEATEEQPFDMEVTEEKAADMEVIEEKPAVAKPAEAFAPIEAAAFADVTVA